MRELYEEDPDTLIQDYIDGKEEDKKLLESIFSDQNLKEEVIKYQ